MKNFENFYILVSVDKNGKHLAYVVKYNNAYDLKEFINSIEDLETANIIPTKKKALEIADEWNKTYLYNGVYLLSETKVYPASINND